MHHLKTLQDFYNSLDTDRISFELPRIERVEPIDNLLVVIEKKISGQVMTDALKDASQDRFNALTKNYFDAVRQVSQIGISPTPHQFSLFDSTSLMSSFNSDWNFFIRSKIEEKVQSLKPTFDTLWFGYPGMIERLLDLFADSYKGRMSIVHGDIFPGNMLVDNSNNITGLIDFGMFTMYGDPLFDQAISWAIHTMYTGNDVVPRQRLLPFALEDIPAKDYSLFWGYVMTYAILSCTSWVGRGETIATNGHFLWALAILTNEYYWENI